MPPVSCCCFCNRHRHKEQLTLKLRRSGSRTVVAESSVFPMVACSQLRRTKKRRSPAGPTTCKCECQPFLRHLDVQRIDEVTTCLVVTGLRTASAHIGSSIDCTLQVKSNSRESTWSNAASRPCHCPVFPTPTPQAPGQAKQQAISTKARHCHSLHPPQCGPCATAARGPPPTRAVPPDCPAACTAPQTPPAVHVQTG